MFWRKTFWLSKFDRRSWLRSTAEEVSAFGQHRKFPPHARKTSGTQGSACTTLIYLCVHCDDHFFIFFSFPQFIYDLFHISLTLISFAGTYEPTIDLLPTSVTSGIARSRVQTRWSPEFFSGLRNCINCVHFDDHFFIFISFPQFIYDLFHISL